MEARVYSVSDIMNILNISRTTAYDYVKSVYEKDNPPFRVIKVGKSYRIIKSSFDKWFNGA